MRRFFSELKEYFQPSQQTLQTALNLVQQCRERTPMFQVKVLPQGESRSQFYLRIQPSQKVTDSVLTLLNREYEKAKTVGELQWDQSAFKSGEIGFSNVSDELQFAIPVTYSSPNNHRNDNHVTFILESMAHSLQEQLARLPVSRSRQ